MGAHYSGNNQAVGTEQDIDVAQIITHEHFSKPLAVSNDIALLILAKPAKLGKGVKLACLPDLNHNLVENKTCWTTGWGSQLEDNGPLSEILMEASLPILTTPCPNDDSVFCARLNESVVICDGDSGGPLVCEFNGKWHLEGISSFSYTHKELNICEPPGGYAKVRFLMPWLMEKIANYKNRTSIPLNTTYATLSVGK